LFFIGKNIRQEKERVKGKNGGKVMWSGGVNYDWSFVLARPTDGEERINSCATVKQRSDLKFISG
jgi:hypothetical protein